jgi:hypothetical protein
MRSYAEHHVQLQAIAAQLPERERRLLIAPWHTLTREEQAEALELGERLGREMTRQKCLEETRRGGRSH